MRLTADNEHQFAPGRAVRIVIDSRGRVLTVNDDNPLGVFWSGRRLKQAAIFSYALLTLSYPFLYGQGMDVFTPIHPWVVITLTFTVSETGASLTLSQTRRVSHSDLPVLGRSHLALFYWPGSPKDYRLPQLIEPMISYRHAQEEWWATRNIPDGW